MTTSLPVIRLNDLPGVPMQPCPPSNRVGAALGSTSLGAMCVTVAAGKQAFAVTQIAPPKGGRDVWTGEAL